jgi:hypothetical protein
MGKTSNAVKQKWNKKHYRQIKISIKPEIADGFQSACKASGKSMANELAGFMLSYLKQSTPMTEPAINFNALKGRRKAIGFAHKLLLELLGAEERYIENTPENLSSSIRYEMAVERADKLSEVIDAVEAIYDD